MFLKDGLACWVSPPLACLSDLYQLISIKWCEISLPVGLLRASEGSLCAEWAQGHQTLYGLLEPLFGDFTGKGLTVHFGRGGSLGARCSPLGVFWPLSSWLSVAFLEDETRFLSVGNAVGVGSHLLFLVTVAWETFEQ